MGLLRELPGRWPLDGSSDIEPGRHQKGLASNPKRKPTVSKPNPCRSPVVGYATPNSFSSCACSQVLSSSTGSVLYDCSESKM